MNSIGWFQAAWLYIWTEIIKNSGIYKLLRKIYDSISGSWQSSRITNAFRTVHFSEEAVRESVIGRFLYLPFRFFEWIQRKGYERLTAGKEGSGIITCCKYLLHNLLALNLRFIGLLLGSGCLIYLLGAGFLGKELSVVAFVGFAAGILLSFLNVNVTSWLGNSVLVRFVSHCLECEFSFDFFYQTKCNTPMRYLAAVLFGALAGAVAAVLSPLYGILLIFGLTGVFLILYKVEAGLYLTVFFAPILPTMMVAGLALLCLVSLIVKAVTSKKFEWKFDGMGMMIFALLLVYLMAAVTSFAQMKSVTIWAIYFAFMSIYFVAINTLKSKKQLFDLLTVFVLSGFLVCLYGVAQYVFKWDVTQAWIDEEMFEDIRMRIYSTLENPNVLGEYILLVLPVCVGLIWTKKKPLAKLIFTGIAAVQMLALILTFSRGCWVGIMVSAVIFITFVAGKLWGLALIALPFVPMFLPKSIINRFTSIGDMTDSSTSYRVYIWMGTLAMIADFWISGIGMGAEAFAQVYPFYSYSSIVAPHSHNLFLQILVESGVVGIGLFLLIGFFFLKNLMSGSKIAGQKTPLFIMMTAIGAAVCGFAVQGMFDNCFYNYRVFAIFWIVLALGMSCTYLAKQEAQTLAERAGDARD